MTRFGVHDIRDEAPARTKIYRPLLEAAQAAVDDAVGELAWSEPQLARTYSASATERYFLSETLWGIDRAGRRVGQDPLVPPALDAVLAQAGFTSLEILRSDGTDSVNAVAQLGDDVRFRYFGRQQVSFWIEITAPPRPEPRADL